MNYTLKADDTWQKCFLIRVEEGSFEISIFPYGECKEVEFNYNRGQPIIRYGGWSASIVDLEKQIIL